MSVWFCACLLALRAPNHRLDWAVLQVLQRPDPGFRQLGAKGFPPPVAGPAPAPPESSGGYQRVRGGLQGCRSGASAGDSGGRLVRARTVLGDRDAGEARRREVVLEGGCRRERGSRRGRG